MTVDKPTTFRDDGPRCPECGKHPRTTLAIDGQPTKYTCSDGHTWKGSAEGERTVKA